MEWYLALLVIFGGLIVIMLSGLPLAFCFILFTIVGTYLLWGGGPGLQQLIISQFNSVTTFMLLPLPMFILIGEVLYHSGIAPLMMDAVASWLGRLPGRLGLVAVGAGTLFSAMTGTSLAVVAMLGSALTPEMEKRGYKKPMSLGPILGSGGLAMMIPPSGLAVLLGALAEISIADILVAMIVPGLSMAVLYATYIIVRCWLQPSLAPPYDVGYVSLSQKLAGTVKYILPVGFIFFLVVGLIFLGIATPTEAGATGALGAFILAFALRRLNWEVVKKAFIGTISVTVMALFIFMSCRAYGQILIYCRVSAGMGEFIMGLPLPPVAVLIVMMVVLLFMGMFINPVAIMVIFIPLYMPIIDTLGFNTVWFAIMFLLNLEMGGTSPPFGGCLFVMKAVAPPDTTLGDCYRAAMPFLYCDAIVLALLIFFPSIALWLPAMIRW